MNYESPIEEKFATALLPLLHKDVKLESQRKFVAAGNNYRVDFFVDGGDRKLVIECDGREFHSFKDDLVRDRNLLEAGCATDIYRIRGCDLTFALEESVQSMVAVFPFLTDPDDTDFDLDIAFIFSISCGHTQYKPIWRYRRNGRFVSLCPPDFDRVFRGQRIWKLADYISCGMQEETHEDSIARAFGDSK